MICDLPKEIGYSPRGSMASELRLGIATVLESEIGSSRSIRTRCGAVLVGWVLREVDKVVRFASVPTDCQFGLLGLSHCCWAN